MDKASLLIPLVSIFLVIRLYTSGLYRRYRAFFLFLIYANVLRMGVLGIMDPATGLYQKIWVLTEPIEWLFYVSVVLELYSLTMKDYRGLSTVGRWSLIAAVCVAMLASGISLMAPSRPSDQSVLMTYYYVAERAVYFSLAVFLLTMFALLMRYPIVLSRNLVVHSMVFSSYFLIVTVLYLWLSARGWGSILGVRYGIFGATVAALGTWLVMLNPAGETRKQRLRPAWMPGQEEALVSQLNHLNAVLLRATHK